MNRRRIRDCIFRIIFRRGFFPADAMEEQIELFANDDPADNFYGTKPEADAPEETVKNPYNDSGITLKPDTFTHLNDEDDETGNAFGGEASDDISDDNDSEALNEEESGISEEETAGDSGISAKDYAYISDKARRVLSHLDEIDKVIRDNTEGWAFENIGKAEIAILRLAVYEMRYDDDIPEKIAINEAVELAKKYCDEKAPGFINGVLAKLASE